MVALIRVADHQPGGQSLGAQHAAHDGGKILAYAHLFFIAAVDIGQGAFNIQHGRRRVNVAQTIRVSSVIDTNYRIPELLAPVDDLIRFINLDRPQLFKLIPTEDTAKAPLLLTALTKLGDVIIQLIKPVYFICIVYVFIIILTIYRIIIFYISFI